MKNPTKPDANARRHHNGVAVLETIIVLPLLIIAVFAIVEFGLLVHRQQHLAEASRNGALTASRLPTSTLRFDHPDGVPHEVRNAVEGRLSESNIEGVDIQFRFGSEASEMVAAQFAATGCDEIPVSEMGNMVWVSLSVPATELAPNLLSTFGFDISQRRYQASALFPYEGDSQ